MNPFTIAARLHANVSDPEWGLLTVTLDTLESIIAAGNLLAEFTEKHGASATLDHKGPQDIIFIRSFPQGFGFDPALVEDESTEELLIIPGFPATREAFIHHGDGKHLCHSECTGLRISHYGGVRIRGYQKHFDELLVSDDILPLIIHHLETEYPDSSAIIVLRLRSLFLQPA